MSDSLGCTAETDTTKYKATALQLKKGFLKKGKKKNPESSRKMSISALLTMPKSLTVWITINCGEF